MLVQRRRRWANIVTTLGQVLMFAAHYTLNIHDIGLDIVYFIDVDA